VDGDVREALVDGVIRSRCGHFADTSRAALPAWKQKPPFPAAYRVGGTGLEPVTPCLSTRSGVRLGSLEFAHGAWLSGSRRASERLSEHERTPSIAVVPVDGRPLARDGGRKSAVFERQGGLVEVSPTRLEAVETLSSCEGAGVTSPPRKPVGMKRRRRPKVDRVPLPRRWSVPPSTTTVSV
jgi:hypothetical protein